MKGIILAGGFGSRLRPITNVISKQLLPVYDKPMIYYPLSTLINALIKDIAIISSPTALPQFKELLRDGSDFGIKLKYFEQKEPNGIAQAFLLTKSFIKDDNVCLILGDNIFHGGEDLISNFILSNNFNCKLFGYKVSNPCSYGVANFDKDKNLINIEEKPKNPQSDIAVTGLYVYDNTVVDKVSNLKISSRGELEITDLNNLYINDNQAVLCNLPEGVAWLDMGTPDGLLQASNYVQTIQTRQGIQVGCPEAVAYKRNFINNKQLLQNYDKYNNTNYGNFIMNLSLRMEE